MAQHKVISSAALQYYHEQRTIEAASARARFAQAYYSDEAVIARANAAHYHTVRKALEDRLQQVQQAEVEAESCEVHQEKLNNMAAIANIRRMWESMSNR